MYPLYLYPKETKCDLDLQGQIPNLLKEFTDLSPLRRKFGRLGSSFPEPPTSGLSTLWGSLSLKDKAAIKGLDTISLRFL